MEFASGAPIPTAQRRAVDGYLPDFENFVGMQGQAAILGATTTVYSIASKLDDSDPNKKELMDLSMAKMKSMLSAVPALGNPDEDVQNVINSF